MRFSPNNVNATKILRVNSIVKQRGFNLVETMLALALLTTFLAALAMFSASNMRKKEAKVLASQTEAFALEFAQYMHANREQITSDANSKPVTLSSQLLKSDWPANIAAKNLFNQTPCVTIIKNLATNNLEAILYYVGGNDITTANQLEIVHSSSVFLGSKGGTLANGEILGNSGWQVTNNSEFLSGATQCGGTISKNSVAINLDLLPNWNLDLQPPSSLFRGVDTQSGLLSLPGHVKNANTSKANIYFNNSNGIVLDNSNPDNKTRLSVLYSGQGTKTPTIGFGDKTSTALIGDTFKTNSQFQSGELCNSDEVGKVVTDQGLNNRTNSYLTRSTLVCTQNDMLCGQGNYCYLPSVQNNIVFQNNLVGIQGSSGRFICPAEVPYATHVVMGTAGGNIYVFFNQSSTKVANSIKTQQEYPSGGSVWQTFTCPLCNQALLTDFLNSQDKNKLLGLDLATISGTMVSTVSFGVPTALPISGSIGEYSAVIGYSVPLVESAMMCTTACTALGGIIGHDWQVLGTHRFERVVESMNIVNSSLGCVCERTDFSGKYADNYTGIAAVIGNFTPLITAVTCSNAAVYSANE
ncbi:MAG: prepilin-type N-terminal cleavage/methylation domain-containing protein [Burkholderiales bacterium]|nr:prepilin-type N-terminal cleavage/methylation domain-containing protein [Burkholderiales bacterium]